MDKFSMIASDLNVNIFNSCPHIGFSIDIMQSHHFLPMITKPSRFPSNMYKYNHPILDQIWINQILNVSSGIILSDITDHCPTFLQISKSTNNINNSKEKKMYFRYDSPESAYI